MWNFSSLNNNTKGILCLMAALAFLTVSDSLIKWLSPRYALHQIMLYRAGFAMIIVLCIVHFEGGLINLKTRRPWLHLLRGSLLVVANMFFFLGLATMPLAQTVTLFFVSPMFICLLAKPVLGEQVGAASWIAIAVGLVGVLIMVRPGAELFVLTSLLPIAAAFTYALMQMITRKLGMHDKAGTLTFYIQVAFIIIGSVVGLIAGDGRFNTESNPTFEFLFRAWVWPGMYDFGLLAVCGFIVAFGGYLMSQAYRIAQASVVAPFEYTSLPLALVIGYLAWGDWPDLISFMGSALIIGSGLLIVYFERKSSSKLTTKGRIARQP